MNDLRQPCEPWAERISLAAAGCLSPDEEADVRRHIETCPDCRERFRQLAELCGLLGQLRLPSGDEEMAVVRRVTSAVSSGKPRRSVIGRIRRVFGRRQREISGPVPRTRHPFDWRRIMRSPVSHVTAAAILLFAVLGSVLWFHGGGATPVLADFTRPIIDAKAAKFKMTFEMEGRPTVTCEAMVLGPYRLRMVSRREMPGRVEIRKVTIYDYQKGKQIVLSPEGKSATVTTFTNMPKEMASANWFAEMRSLLVDARDKPEVKREPLGEKEIDGHRAVGFRVTRHRGIDDGVVTTVWGNPETGLPVRVETIIRSSGKEDKVTMSDFVFNAGLDESLFSVEPPTGYTTQNLRMDFSPGEEKDLIETLRRYSQQGGGTFPDVLDLPAAERYAKAFRFQTKNGHKPTDQEIHEKMQEDFDAHAKLTRGLRFVLQLPPDADVHYAGKCVKRGTVDTPIFWYRPKDAKKYRVIYADFSVREVDTPPQVPGAKAVLAPLSPKK